MDGSQITGASSSYARKYALNGLLCIDDTADSDTTNVGTVAEEARANKARKKAEAEAPEPEYQPLGSAQYWGVVKAFVDGKRTKSGGDYRAVWISTTHATPEAIARFDADVENVRAARSANILK
jgi:hypothetical protein